VQLEKDIRERRLNAWQRTLTPEDIKRENRFRAAQRKAGLSRRANIKDPNAPKKPLSAYFMFLARIRSDPALVYEVFGDETETTRQSVLAARRWREMSDEEKKVYHFPLFRSTRGRLLIVGFFIPAFPHSSRT
jgi:hypothetical protein